jgi:hypothetical protein
LQCDLADHPIDFGVFEFRTVGGKFKCYDMHPRNGSDVCAESRAQPCLKAASKPYIKQSLCSV